MTKSNKENKEINPLAKHSPPRPCNSENCPLKDKWSSCPMAGHEVCGYDIDDD